MSSQIMMVILPLYSLVRNHLWSKRFIFR